MIPGYRPVTRKHPCPICGKPTSSRRTGYCLIHESAGHVICGHAESDRQYGEAGWRHDLDDETAARLPSLKNRAVRDAIPSIDCAEIQKELIANLDDGFALTMAAELGVRYSSLARLGMGKTRFGHASFPMRDGDGNIIGFRIRTPAGRKYAITGSRSGLFIPDDIRNDGLLFITEGPTDTAAMLSTDLMAVGRPSCNGGARMLIHLLSLLDVEPVIVSDNDGPGINGARTLSGILRGARVMLPPSSCKDVRQWLSSGVSRKEIVLRAANAGYSGVPS